MPFELHAGAGERIEVANLLQPQNQLEHVPDRGAVAHLGQPHDALFLGKPVAFALFGRQIERLVVEQLGRQVAEHLVFRAAQDVVADGSPDAARLHLRREKTRGEKLENAEQVVDAVFDRRAGQRPVAFAGNRADHLVGRAGAILDPLRFVEYHEVEMPIGQEIAISQQHFIVGQSQRDVGQLPLPAALGLIAFDGHDRHFRGPNGELALPVRHQRLRADQQHTLRLAATQQQTDGGDRLHCLAEAHLVGQDRRLTRIQKRDAFKLERERAKRERRAIPRPTAIRAAAARRIEGGRRV